MTLTAARAVVLGASWGGVDASIRILGVLPADFPLPILLVQHQRYDAESRLATVLTSRTALPVVAPQDKEPLLPGTVYVAPPGFHMLVESEREIALSCHWQVHYSRPSIDELFISAADVYGSALIGVLLTGANEDGAAGIEYIHRRGGSTIVQDPATAEAPAMPEAAIATGCVDYIVPLEEVGHFLSNRVLGQR